MEIGVCEFCEETEALDVPVEDVEAIDRHRVEFLFFYIPLPAIGEKCSNLELSRWVLLDRAMSMNCSSFPDRTMLMSFGCSVWYDRYIRPK